MGVTAAQPDTAKAQALGRIESEGLLVGDFKSQRIKTGAPAPERRNQNERQKTC